MNLIFRGVRFLATLDRFLTPPNFRGCQVPGYPGQVPGTPEKQNLTKNLETGLKLNISKKFFQNLLTYNKLEFWEACSNLYLQKKRFRGARNLSTLDRNLSRVDRFLSRVARNLSPLGFLVLILVGLEAKKFHFSKIFIPENSNFLSFQGPYGVPL